MKCPYNTLDWKMAIQNILDRKMSICVKKNHNIGYLHLVQYKTEIFESWSFIANTTAKKVLSLNEYSKVFYQNPQSELFKVWMAFRCVDRDLWELKLYCKYYSQKSFILEWMCFIKIRKAKSSRYEWPLDLLTDILLKLYCKDVGPGKFAKKHKCRALNKRRASEF